MYVKKNVAGFLQHGVNQSQAFDTLSTLLKSGGKLWILVPTLNNLAWKQAHLNLQAMPKWAPYWKHILPRKFLSIEEYTTLLTGSNFQPVKIQKVQTQDPFVDREEFLRFLLGTFTLAVPPEMSEEYYNAIIDEYLRLLPEALLQNGVIEARFG